jgi:calcium/proton exchanger cax
MGTFALLACVPLAIALEHLAPQHHLWIFLVSALAILPLAGWMGRATEALAHHTGEGVGGLLNATFGNAAELIIAIAALREGLLDVVKASLAGSIVGNILLVLGASMLAGGVRNGPEQHFNASGVRSQATMLTLATIGLSCRPRSSACWRRGLPVVLAQRISIVLPRSTRRTCPSRPHQSRAVHRVGARGGRGAGPRGASVGRSALTAATIGVA